MPFPRSSGILLHPSCFPSRFGIGDLGSEAYQFVDFLSETKQQFWQILPLSPYGDDPYKLAYGAMAGNPLLISLEKLRDDGWLRDADLANVPDFPVDRVDYTRVIETKLPLLEKACETFKVTASQEQQQQFYEFCESKAYWLDDYALFMAFRDAFGGNSWCDWKPEIKKREPKAMEQWRKRLASEIFFHKYMQFEFFRQWMELKNYTNERGIQIIGDIAIYVTHNSADVWANQEIFSLDEETGEPTLVSGVPPDYFSATGQLWGTPVYNWEKVKQQNFRWWVQRFQAVLDAVDLVRIDHFRGLQAYWEVKQGEKTAMNGKWVEAPGEELLNLVNQNLGKLPIIAEDLGVITPEVEALRDQFEFPGMKILQFAFDDTGPDNTHLPLNYPRNCIVYTGTHDNDTTLSWFEQLSAREKQEVESYLGCISSEGIHWDLIRLAMSSVANQAIIPLQDILGLGGEGRMNDPSQTEGNWVWRYRPGAIPQSGSAFGGIAQEMSDRLKTMTETFGRAPNESY